MFVHYRSKGLILKKTGRGESDELFTVYTKDFGKLDILGKAIRKISSKLRSGAENLYFSEIEFIQGKAYKTLTDAILIEKFGNIRRDLGKLAIASKISEVLDDLTIGGQEADEKVWQLTMETLRRLDGSAARLNICLLLYYYFLWNLFFVLGYKPELYCCAACRKRLTVPKFYFNSKEGGIVCPDCFNKGISGKEISPEAIKIIRIILEKKWQTLSKLKIEEKYFQGLKLVSENYLSFVSERAG